MCKLLPSMSGVVFPRAIIVLLIRIWTELKIVGRILKKKAGNLKAKQVQYTNV